MSRIALNGGFYQSKSLIAAAQRCVNLYPEINPADAQSPVQVTTYLTPGLRLLAQGAGNRWRGLFRASNGDLYGVLGDKAYYIDSSWNLHLLGNVTVGLSTPVSMANNSGVLVIVDGSANGYVVDLATKAFGSISPTNFYGADVVNYLDTYFIFNKSGSSFYYISLSAPSYAMLIGGTAFDPLDISGKGGYPDFIQSMCVMHRELWITGTLTTNVHYNSGAADFTFEQQPGAFMDHGCIARYSLARADLFTFWLSQDMQGQGIVLMGNASYTATRISTHALEQEFATYERLDDAIGFTYQQEGHLLYVLTFPTADKTWVFDRATEIWHERGYTDNDGILHRVRYNCFSNAYNTLVVGDWENGNLYALDIESYTDNGQPISRIRSFPHIVNDGNRIYHSQFIADMQVGETPDFVSASPPLVSLRWSDDRGKSYGNRVEQSLGAAGQYLTSIQWQRLGYARDRIFELSWSAPVKTSLNGAWLQAKMAKT